MAESSPPRKNVVGGLREVAVRRDERARRRVTRRLRGALVAPGRIVNLATALLCSMVAPIARSGRWHLRRGHALERLGRTSAAVRAYRRAVSRGDRRPEWFVLLAELHERAGEPALAAEVLRQASDAFPEHLDLHRRRGEASTRSGDIPGAIRAYERAVDHLPAARAGDLRYRLAELYDRVGRWSAARAVLEEQLAADPEDAEGLRRLARVAERIWRWGGSLEENDPRADAPGFRSVVSIAGSDDEPLHAARRALEQAVALEPTRWAWRGALGELREAAGDYPGAIACYEAMLEREVSSNRVAAFRDAHRWEFALERARHLAGAARVEDPLFAAAIDIDPEERTTPRSLPVGCFEAYWTFGGLGVRGFVTSPDIRRVDVLVDDVLLRRLNVQPGAFLPQLGQAVGRQVLEQFPTEARLRVRTEQGDELFARGRGKALRLTMPTGAGRLHEVLQESGGLDKKGLLAPGAEEMRRRRAAYLRLYDTARTVFERTCHRSLFVIHGTLLGVHREGDLIAGDDDFDVAYVSSATTPAGVKAEAMQHIRTLVREGFTVSFNRSGRLFRLHGGGAGESVHLDVHPAWFEDDRLWLHNDVCLSATVDDFLPVEQVVLDSVTVDVPRHPEVFLEGQYGSTWDIPDPGFMSRRSATSSAVLKHLSKAFITPHEYRELKAELAREAESCPGTGRFVAVGLQPLYPLDDFVP